MNREILEQPFDPAQIRQRQGPFGNRLDYVEGHAVIQRLNDALDCDWSFEVVEHGALEQHDEILVLGGFPPVPSPRPSSDRAPSPGPRRPARWYPWPTISKPLPPMP